MSDNNEFNQDDTNGQPSGSGLRAKLEQALAENAQLKKQFEELQSKETERAVNTTWDELKVPDAIRTLYKGEQSVDAIKQWVEAGRGFFNFEAAQEAPVEQQATPEQLAAQAAAEAFADASSIGTDTNIGGVDALQAKVQAAKGLKGAELAAAKAEIYKALQVPEY